MTIFRDIEFWESKKDEQIKKLKKRIHDVELEKLTPDYKLVVVKIEEQEKRIRNLEKNFEYWKKKAEFYDNKNAECQYKLYKVRKALKSKKSK